jgi:DedD protein
MAISLLAIPGFALGLVAGVAWEDPRLLALHVFGGGESVAWEAAPDDPLEAPEAAASAPALPDVAASPEAPPARPSATRIRPEVVTPGTAAAAPAATPARNRPARAAQLPAQAPAAGHFAVQVGAFGEPDVAERLAESLRGKGFAVYVSPGAGAGDTRWRVRVGPLATRDEAERVAGRLKAQEKLPTWVLDEDAV